MSTAQSHHPWVNQALPISTPETGRLGESDESQLQWASEEGRILITFNVAHFADLHSQCMKQGRHHAGIVVSPSRNVVLKCAHVTVTSFSAS